MDHPLKIKFPSIPSHLFFCYTCKFGTRCDDDYDTTFQNKFSKHLITLRCNICPSHRWQVCTICTSQQNHYTENKRISRHLKSTEHLRNITEYNHSISNHVHPNQESIHQDPIQNPNEILNTDATDMIHRISDFLEKDFFSMKNDFDSKIYSKSQQKFFGQTKITQETFQATEICQDCVNWDSSMLTSQNGVPNYVITYQFLIQQIIISFSCPYF